MRDPNRGEERGEKRGKKEGTELKPETVEILRGMLDQADHYLRQVRQLLFAELYRGKAERIAEANGQEAVGDKRVVEGVFDGEQMRGQDGRRYPVPPNYASKSKLVAGDILKLSISEDGSFIYKQIGPVERRMVVGVLEEHSGEFTVRTEARSYRVLAASVSYYQAKPGDQLTVILPREGEGEWAAVENLLEEVRRS